MVFDGKTYRNLQDQVAYLTAKWQELADEIDAVRAQIPSKMIVEELPEEGDPLITYYVGPKGTEPDLYYEVWVWVQEEPDGPFVWRELEDTDQVDLSGYLPIQDDVTTLPQVYGKTETGEQAMLNVDIAATALTIPFRDTNGRTKVAAPDADGDAANKKYCVDSFVAKQTGSTSYAQAYAKGSSGIQIMVDISNGANANTVAQRDANGRLTTKDPANNADALNLSYANDHYLAKQTGATSYYQVYSKATDGSQTMLSTTDSVVNNTIPFRDAAGQLNVPATPTANAHAASKAYVDAAVGQLLYLHDINLVFTIDASNYLIVRAHLVSGSPTAITSLTREQFARMNVEYGSYGTSNNASNVSANAICSVTKLPDSFRFDSFDEPYTGFLYQYVSGSSLLWGVADYTMTVTVTDVVVSF